MIEALPVMARCAVACVFFATGCHEPPELTVVESRTVMVDGEEHVEVAVQTSPGVEVLLGTPYQASAGESREGLVGAGTADATGRVTLRARLPSYNTSDTQVRADLTIPMEDTADNVFQQLTVPRSALLTERVDRDQPPILVCNFGGCSFGIGAGGRVPGPPPGGQLQVGGQVPTPIAGDEHGAVQLPMALFADLDMATAVAQGSPDFETTVRMELPGGVVFEGPYRIPQWILVRQLLERWKDAREPLAVAGEPEDGTIIWIGGNGSTRHPVAVEVVGPTIPFSRIRRVTALFPSPRRLGCGTYRGGGTQETRTRMLYDLRVAIYDSRTGVLLEERAFRARDPGCAEAVVAGGSSAGSGYVPEEEIRAWLTSRL